MIYRSNIDAPDIDREFEHIHSRPMPHSFGHDVPSDWADKDDDDLVFGLYKRCGMWTHDEAAILYRSACRIHTLTRFALDIGAHTGWTTAHIAAAALRVAAVDPMLSVKEFQNRFKKNLRGWEYWVAAHPVTSQQYFEKRHASDEPQFSLVCIDGDHEPGKPLEDAKNAVEVLDPDGVILLHDGTGQPVREAVTWLMKNGFEARIYWTPHIVFACWRPEFGFNPVVHTPDLTINWTAHRREMARDFNFGRLT